MVLGMRRIIFLGTAMDTVRVSVVTVEVATIVMVIDMRPILDLRATDKGNTMASIVLPGFVARSEPRVFRIRRNEVFLVAVEVTAVVMMFMHPGACIRLPVVEDAGAGEGALRRLLGVSFGSIHLLVDVVLIRAELGVLLEVNFFIMFVIEMPAVVMVVEVVRAMVLVKMTTVVVVVNLGEVLPLGTHDKSGNHVAIGSVHVVTGMRKIAVDV
jgi:hypothetical protein